MKRKSIFILFICILSLFSFDIPKNLQKKVDKEIKDVFQVDAFFTQDIEISEDIKTTLPIEIKDNNFFKVLNNEKHTLGYVFFGIAPSKTAEFDYLVVFDENLIIQRAKVLVYREEYGGEIGSKRWLKQFIGKTEHDELEYQKNIAAISGATISVRSMTNAVNDLLKAIGILHENKIL
ncbi:FMN-binding protein [Leptobacterium sp. I13]|uniref:FMN-binding protein n=1 Tax=Leptobacterium meishanense TaxID=3128904 RepID=UPI0030EB961D